MTAPLPGASGLTARADAPGPVPPGSDLLLARDRAALLAAILAHRTAYVPDWLPRVGGPGHGLADLLAGQLELLASSPDLGEARESLPTEYKGGPVEIGFNAQYLLDFLGAAGTDTVQLDLKDSESQGTLRPAPGGDTDYRYVVMPIRL